MSVRAKTMVRWLAAMVFACVGLSTFAQTEQAVHGPKTYNHPHVLPSLDIDVFDLPAGVSAPFRMHVKNGQANGQNRVDTAWVFVNGVQVAGPGNFDVKVYEFDRTVTLRPHNNTVVVIIAGQANRRFEATFFARRIQPAPTSLSPNPLNITAGASGTLTATLAPAPTVSGALNINSSNNGVASVPASVAFAAGQTQVAIPVAGGGAGSATVSATLNGASASATVNVTPAAPTLTSLAPGSLTLTQGANGTLTATISSSQPTDTQISVSSSNSGSVSVPSSVTVPAGQASAPISVGALTAGTSQVTATLNGSSVSSQVTVTPAPPTVVSLVPAVSTVTLGASATLTLTISSAQAVDTVVPLAVSPPGIVQAPAEVTVLAGQTQVLVPVGTLAYGQAGVTASLNGSTASSVINVVPPPVAVTNLQPATFAMNVGTTSQYTVSINAAQTTNTDIALSTDQPSVLQVPVSVTVAQGATSAVFTVTGLAQGNAVITASANSTTRTAAVHVSPQPAAIVSLLPNPLPLQSGATGSLTVTINVAQEVDTAIALSNTNPAAATAPVSVTIAAGTISTGIPVTAVAEGSTVVTASVNATSAASTVNVTPPPPVASSIAPATLTLPKGTPGVLRVNVSRAPNVATAVTLISSDPLIASVPPEVNIPAGALFADFPVVANSQGPATITASLNGGSATAAVTIAAPELVALTLSPQAPANYIGESVPFTATGTLTDGSTQDYTAQVSWASSDAQVASIAASGIASVLAAGQTTISASNTFTSVLSAQPVTVTTSTVLTGKAPVGLVLTATATTLIVGQNTTVTVTSSDPAPAGGLVVALTPSGNGAGTFPPAVSIAANGTQATFTFTATVEGSVSITATAQNRLPGSITFGIAPQLQISSFTPAAGPVGSAVSIIGTGFDPVAGNNQLRFNGIPSVIVNASPTVLNAIVPLKATTGPISITNVRGTATSSTSFTVQERESFDFTLTPAAVSTAIGGNGATRLRLVSTGLNSYPYSAAVTVSGLPAGVTATFDKATLALGQDSILNVTTQAAATPGTYPITVTATGISGLATVARVQTLNLTVLAVGSTTVSGRVLHADDGAPFIGARIRLGAVQVFTDETGTYRFVSPPVVGDQVLLIDGGTNNTPQFEFPSAIAMPVMIVNGQDNKALTSYIQKVDASKFTTITPGQAASVTNADIPGFSLNIPNGATLFGWDGQPITKVNVRTVPVDRLPIKPIPAGQTSKSVYLYYFFKEGGANPTTPIPVTMANDVDALPGEQIEMWYYDEDPVPNANSNQWKLMGMGTVSADGKSVVSNAGVGIPKFCCGASRIQRNVSSATGALAGNARCPTCVPGAPGQPTTVNPVDLGSGNAMVFQPRPFGLSVLMPVDPSPQYRSTDTRIGLFGRGMSFSYDWFVTAQGGQAVLVVAPGGGRFLLSLEGDGRFRSRSGLSASIDMEVSNITGGRRLRLADGSEFDFDTAGRLTVMRDLNGNTTTFSLNAQGFPQSMTDATGKVYTFTLTGTSPTIRISRIQDPAGRAVNFEYDGALRMFRYTDQAGGVTQLGYDGANRIVQMTDPRGAVKTIEYDAANRATREVLPESAEERYAYTTVGNAITETRHTDGNGNVTTYRFNGFGFSTQTIDALGRVATNDLDPVTNKMRSRTDAAGRKTQMFYNARGDLIRTVDADNKETLIEYDARFRKPTRIQNALNNVTTMVYDVKGNLTSLTNAENEVTTFTYTPKGQFATVVDPLNRTTSFTYDSEGNLLTSTNTAGEVVTRTYDGANRLFLLTDSLNRVTQFDYDNLDRVKEVRDAIGGLTKYAYDANDNLLSATDARNNPVERNIYDLRNRLKTRTDAKNKNTTYNYDGVGNLTSMTDRKGQVTSYTYDALNRITQIQDPERTTGYAYDLAGNLARMTDSQSGEMLMSYDVLDRLTEVVTAQGTVQYGYDVIGRRTSRTLSGGDVTTYTYDKVNRLKTVTLRNRTATYNYDIAGRLTEKILPNGLKTTYQYDAADRVTNIAYTKPDNTPVESVSYGYDAAGQRIVKTEGQQAPADTTFSATYDESNRLTAITIAGEPFTLAYDDNGNLTTKTGPVAGTTTYGWSARNQLISLSSPAGSATFKYDAMGRRIEKTVNGSTTGFLYDGAQAIAELRGGSIDTVFHTGVAIDEVLARYAPTGNKTLLTDALMSVIAQANDSQGVDNFYAYSPYGEVAVLGPDGGNDLQYAALRNDATGLYHAMYRYYDPVLKQWISEDPIGLDGGINQRRYVRNNPVRFNDPLGLDETILNNAAGGRSRWDGPTNGNWGGKCWGGGRYSCGPAGSGTAQPTDSGDACYMRHDNCWDQCRGNGQCMAACDRVIVDELRNLPDDPRRWPQPPRPGTEGDSRNYRNWAIRFFQ